MENKELQGVVDAIMRGMTALEDSMNQKFAEVNKKFEAIDERFDAIDKRFDAIDKRFDTLEEKVEDLEEAILDMGIVKATVDKHDHDIKRLKRNATM